MNQFLLRLSLFSLLVLVLAWGTDAVVTTLLKKSKQLNYGVWNDLINGKIDSKIVIHGSSKAWVQVNTSIIEKEFKTTAYNLGLDAFGFNMQYCRHQLLLKHNKHPEVIIHAVDVAMFDDDSLLYEKNQFLPYLNDSIITQHIRFYKGLNFFERNLPFVRYIGAQGTLKHAAKILIRPDLNVPDRYKGFAGQHLEWTDDYANARQQYPDGITVQVFPPIVDLFKKYISDCHQRNTTLILVYCPEFKDGIGFQKNSDEVIQLLQRIAAEHNVPFINLRSSESLADKKYYYNNNHLNAEGADIFTRLLCDEIKKYNYIER